MSRFGPGFPGCLPGCLGTLLALTLSLAGIVALTAAGISGVLLGLQWQAGHPPDRFLLAAVPAGVLVGLPLLAAGRSLLRRFGDQRPW